MFGFFRRRRLAREAAAREAELQRLRAQRRPMTIDSRPAVQSSSSSSSSVGLGLHDPLHSLNPLNPLSPLSAFNQADAYAAPRSEPEPVRSHCSPSVSDDSWSRSSSSGSDYSCSSSSSDSGSSSSSSDSSSY